ncbi:hypothetical protein [Thioalkalivibrio sp.]|uniref:hypothetical protein n=1 Tax=Thioalkalivibrio sp. TaxID=2093813 RepID=UPI0039754DE6
MALFKRKIVIDDDRLERIKAHIDRAGFASVEEFVYHCIDKELHGEPPPEDLVTRRVRGLGYMD